MVGFVGGCVQGMEPIAIIVKDDAWNLTYGKVMVKPVLLATSYADKDNWIVEYVLATNNTKINTLTMMVILIPMGLME